MIPLDLVILFPIVLFAAQGFRNGIVREVLTIAGVILAVFVAFQTMGQLAEMIQAYVNQPKDVLVIISGLILFTATMVLALSVALLIRKFLELIKLNFINRLFGIVFGGVKGALVISALLLLLAGLDFPAEGTRNSSLVYPYIIRLAPLAYNFVALAYPGSDDFINNIRNTLEETNPAQNLLIL